MEWDEFQNFDPQAFWAVVNNELPRLKPGFKDSKKAEEIIQLCKKPRTPKEICSLLRVQQGKLNRLLYFISHMRGISMELRKGDDGFSYQMRDGRTL